MPTTSFTYSAADGLKVAAAFKSKFSEQYAAMLVAFPAMTDEQFVKACTRIWWEGIVRDVRVAAVSDAERIAAEAQVQAAVEAAIVAAEITVT